MKKGIHPELHVMDVVQTDGSTFQVRTTSKAGRLVLDVDSKSHPAFTGENRMILTTGRVEQFEKKFKWDPARVEEAKKKKKTKAAGDAAVLQFTKTIKTPKIVDQKKEQRKKGEEAKNAKAGDKDKKAKK